MNVLLTLDSNVFVCAYKGNEEYSQVCLDLIKRIPDEFTLVEPAIVITETYRAIGKYFGDNEGKMRAENVKNMSHTIVSCDTLFCMKAGKTAIEYGVYSADSLYLQAMLTYITTLISLDDEFLRKVKEKDAKASVCHIKDFFH